MRIGEFTASLLFTVLMIVLFPALNEACQNVAGSSPIAGLIRAFPLVFVVLVAALPAYFAITGD